MENVQAELSIELNITCPNCLHYFDLFDFEGGRLNDDGYLMKNACPDGYWCDSHEQFKEQIKCPDCKSDFEVQGIAW